MRMCTAKIAHAENMLRFSLIAPSDTLECNLSGAEEDQEKGANSHSKEVYNFRYVTHQYATKYESAILRTISDVICVIGY